MGGEGGGPDYRMSKEYRDYMMRKRFVGGFALLCGSAVILSFLTFLIQWLLAR